MSGRIVEVAGDAVRVAPGIGDRDEFDAVELAEHPGVVPAHHADAEQAGAQGAHQAPAPATAFTAATMRSRSSCESDG